MKETVFTPWVRFSHSTFKFVLLIKAFTFATLANCAIYYVSASGNDQRSGLSPDAAWSTVGRVNSQDLLPGDTVCFEGGRTFAGGLQIYPSNRNVPITITSYGEGKATIASGDEIGLGAWGPGGIDVFNIDFQGSGADRSEAIGINFSNGLYEGQGANYTMRYVRVSGYFVGVYITGDPIYGLRDISLSNSNIEHNAVGIILGYDNEPRRIFHNVSIRGINANDNNSRVHGMSGIGINLLNVANGLVELNSLYRNGPTSLNPGGPSGLLVDQSSNLLIQKNSVFDNYTPGHPDNQGIVLYNTDNSIVQYNYARRNGTSYQILNDTGNPNVNITFRYNISEWERVAGIVVFGDCDGSKIYNNTIYSAISDGSGTYPVILGYLKPGSLYFMNNLIFARDGAPAVMVTQLDEGAQPWLLGNVYHTAGIDPLLGDTAIIWDDEGYYSVDDFRRITGQETWDGAYGLVEDPLLFNPGGAGEVQDPNAFPNITAYRLRDGSPARNAGVDLRTHFGIDVGTRDFFANPLPVGGSFSVGAHQYPR